jgi:hypothetical protein
VEAGEPGHEITLVVRAAARVEDSVADLRREGVGGPELERINGLDVVVVVNEEGALTRSDLADERRRGGSVGQAIRGRAELRELRLAPARHAIQPLCILGERGNGTGFTKPVEVALFVRRHELAQGQVEPPFGLCATGRRSFPGGAAEGYRTIGAGLEARPSLAPLTCSFGFPARDVPKKAPPREARGDPLTRKSDGILTRPFPVLTTPLPSLPILNESGGPLNRRSLSPRVREKRAMSMAQTLKRTLLGRAMASGELPHTLFRKVLALPVFSSDPLSSNAYATQELLLVLGLVGRAPFTSSFPSRLRSRSFSAPLSSRTAKRLGHTRAAAERTSWHTRTWAPIRVCSLLRLC